MRAAPALLFVLLSSLVVPAIAQTPPNIEKQFEKRVADAVALYKAGKLPEAIKAFEAIHADVPKSYDGLSWLGFLYVRAKRPGEAIPLLEQALLAHPGDVDVLTNLGDAYLANREYDKAVDRYQTVVKQSPKMFEPHYNLGTIYLQRKQFPKAVAEFQIASRLKPDDPFVQNNLGVAFEAQNNLPRAAAAFRKASEMRPDNLTFARNAGLLYSRMHLPEALPFLEKALGDGTDPAVALALGEAYSRAGRSADALKYYEGLRTVEAKNETFWFNLAVLRAEAKDLTGAEQAYRRVLELNPTDLDALNNLGLLFYKEQKFAEATTLFDKLSGLEPGSISAKMNLAAAAVSASQLPKAIEAWKDIVRIEPTRSDVRLDLANALWHAGDIDGARFHYMQILQRDKDNAEALNGLGLCYLRTDKLPQAEAAFRSATKAKSTYAAAYNNLAITLEREKQPAKAIEALTEALQNSPDNEEIKKNLARLRTGG